MERATKAKKIQKGNAYNIIKIAVGYQFKFFPLFLDKRGLFVERCRKLFTPGTPLNIVPDMPVGVSVQAQNPTIELIFLPDKVIVSQTKAFPTDKFEGFLRNFHKNFQDFFNDCEPVFMGAVIEIEVVTDETRLVFATPTVERKYRYSFKGKASSDEKGVYRVALDTQKIVDVTFEDITSILKIALKKIDEFVRT